MKKDIEILIEKIKAAQSIAISGHKNPDGDALCSALALMKIIELNFGKSATVIYDGNIPRDLENVPLRKKAHFCGRLPEDSSFDLYILVDYGTKIHLGGAAPFVEKADFVIEFDHHLNAEPVGNLCFDNAEKAATAQVIYNVVRSGNLRTNQDIIDLLTLAIITDTGNFKFARHGDVFRDTAKLVESGANMTKLVNLLNNKDKKTVLVETKAVSNAEFLMKGKLAIATITHADYKKLDGRGEIVLRLLGQIEGVQYVVLLKEQKENQIGISIRSRNIPINHIAESFGGGGHLYAAGAVVFDSSLSDIHEKIIQAFKGM